MLSSHRRLFARQLETLTPSARTALPVPTALPRVTPRQPYRHSVNTSHATPGIGSTLGLTPGEQATSTRQLRRSAQPQLFIGATIQWKPPPRRRLRWPARGPPPFRDPQRPSAPPPETLAAPLSTKTRPRPSAIFPWQLSNPPLPSFRTPWLIWKRTSCIYS